MAISIANNPVHHGRLVQGGTHPLLAGLRRLVLSLLCGWRGHLMVRHFEPDRLSLRCLYCGKQTPGWSIDVQPQFRGRARVIRAAPRRPASSRAA